MDPIQYAHDKLKEHVSKMLEKAWYDEVIAERDYITGHYPGSSGIR
jgi:hypothetical protein